MSVMYSYEFTAEGPGPDVDCLDDAIRIGELGELYNGRVKTLPQCCAVRSSGGDPGPLPDLIVDRCSRAAEMPPDKWLEASFLVNYGCIRPILHMTELFPTLRFRGSFQSDMECEEAHYEFE